MSCSNILFHHKCNNTFDYFDAFHFSNFSVEVHRAMSRFILLNKFFRFWNFLLNSIHWTISVTLHILWVCVVILCICISMRCYTWLLSSHFVHTNKLITPCWPGLTSTQYTMHCILGCIKCWIIKIKGTF